MDRTHIFFFLTSNIHLFSSLTACTVTDWKQSSQAHSVFSSFPQALVCSFFVLFPALTYKLELHI